MYILRCIAVFGLLVLLLACNETQNTYDHYDDDRSSLNDLYDKSPESSLSGLFDLYDNRAGSDIIPVSLSRDYHAVKEDEYQAKIDRKIIRNGGLVFEVDDLDETRKHIQDLLTTLNGYISSEREVAYSSRTSVTLVARVEASSFDRLLAGVSTSAVTIDEKEVLNKDVTEKFLDVETRLKNKKTLEARYLELLKSARTVTEILDIEKEIGTLREDIESVEGRLNYLKDQTSMSTLSMTFYVVTGQPSHFLRSIGNGFSDGWYNLGRLLVGLVNVWPFLILIFLGIWSNRRWRKK